MKFEPKQKLYITITGSVILLIAVFFFLVIPFVNSLQETSEAFLQNREELTRLTERQKQLGNLENEYKKNQELLEKIDEALYEQDIDDLEFILLIEDIAKRTDNTHTLSPPTYHVSSQDTPYFSSSIALEGSFDGLLRFLELFGVMKFYADIDGITISNAGKKIISSGNASTLKTTISFKVFMQ